MNAGKNKVMVFERRKVEGIDLNTPYRLSASAVERCEKKRSSMKKRKWRK